MREILFRGMRTKNGEWVYGFYCQKPCPCTEDGNPITHYIADLPPFGTEVDPDTVGQFTGLTDGHGKRIFEGDIVEATIIRSMGGGEETRKEIGMIAYDGIGMIGLVVERYAGHNIWSDFFQELTLSGCIFDFGFKVIGNIHDNPELLNTEARSYENPGNL